MGTILAGLKALAALFGFGQKVVEEIHDKNQRDAGATAQREASDDATLDTLKRVSAPISDADADELWDRNKAKFGPGSKAGG